MTQPEFIGKINQAYQEAVHRGARLNRAVVIAQAALESDWGNSVLAQKANNLFSIKAGAYWTGKTLEMSTTEWNPAFGWYPAKAIWRSYPSWTDCILDYGAIIAGLPWYQDALSNLDDPRSFLKALLPNGAELGWATDPGYYDKVLRIAKQLEDFGGPKW